MDGLGPQSSLNMTDRRKGLGKNQGVEQEGHSGPFLRAPNRAQFKNETSPRGEATQSLLGPLGPLRGEAAHLQASPRAHKPQHWPRGSPKHGEPSRLIPQTSKSSVGHTVESSARTTAKSTAVCPRLILRDPAPAPHLPPACSFHCMAQAGPSFCSRGSVERPAGLTPVPSWGDRGDGEKDWFPLRAPPRENCLHPWVKSPKAQNLSHRILCLSLLF